MKKQLILIGIAVILVTAGLSGCTDNNNDSSKINKVKILGQWTAMLPTTTLTLIMKFYTNGSFYEGLSDSINDTVLWGTYTMTDKTLTLQYGDVIHTVQYSFSDNDNTLTLVETDDGAVYLELTKP